MRVLILGSEGCVGTAVSHFFEQMGHDVVRWDIRLGNQYDLRESNNVDEILPMVDFVLFLAFDVGGSKYNVHSLQYIENNMELMRNTFSSLQKCPKPFIYTSSMMSNMNNNPYAVLKRLGELYTDILEGINVKLWNVYGSEPITEKSHVIPDFLHQAIHTDTIQMRTDGKEERLFLYSYDLASALHTIMLNYNQFQKKEIIDISSRTWISIKDIAETIKELTLEILHKTIAIQEGTYIDTFHNRKNEPEASLLDTLWKPQTTLKEGIRSVFLSMIEPKT
jgi:nucleoside-diphosphate-sugar epimerase